ncbi:HET domain protein [Rasamsonia emersonii CBS 393.64]|uniref:HET domain protein n=1 Tax=Rasamsonia emersonii (strain ATCC 16479 / CBS 393.64 / IMI 116815) TaxID=1408163 RepID=A0A0F4YPC2_RASE3|nr:HET domain protein [Rasamsonia emersonii CBS 393.64]KKA19676.1 HET domain protein [Rasamsonia emersonii CBS 393.64]
MGRKKVLNLRAINPDAQFGQQRTQHMCPWAFERLRSDRAAILQDFRIFHERFKAIFADQPPRCSQIMQDGVRVNVPCNGSCPQACQRRMCPTLLGRNLLQERGRRPSRLVGTNDQRIYQTLSCVKNTLAISHVWSHGQGGRPEDGFNSCLHQRYTAIAKDLGCDSYWMDTPCIPNDYALRNEAIENINRIFADSKATLICDRDLMDIDISDLTLTLRESILATLMVCDWDVRAWTLLEGMRGRRNVYILCRDRKTVSLQECFKIVLYDGRLDLIALLLATQHVIPYSSADDVPERSKGTWWENLYAERIRGRISVQEGTCLLSHRHASRPGDEIVIWSLLLGDVVHRTPVDFWRAQEGQIINTGLLMSSIPRIKGHKGLGWAPTRPNLPFDTTTQRFPAYDGNATAYANITRKGLEGFWLIAKFKQSKFKRWIRRFLSSHESQGRILGHGTRTQTGEGWRDSPGWYQGESNGPLFAIVVSSNGYEWKWKEVFEWDGDTSSMPVMKVEKILLISSHLPVHFQIPYIVKEITLLHTTRDSYASLQALYWHPCRPYAGTLIGFMLAPYRLYIGLHYRYAEGRSSGAFRLYKASFIGFPRGFIKTYITVRRAEGPEHLGLRRAEGPEHL